MGCYDTTELKDIMKFTKEDYLNSLKSWTKYSPWLLDGYCDEQGRCWFQQYGKWKLIKPEDAYNTITCLPAHINPLKEPTQMTREEFYEKYGDVKVKFSTYYKYTFTYVGEQQGGGKVSVGICGNGSDIYHAEVNADECDPIKVLYTYCGTAYDNDGNVVDEFYDY